MYGGTTHEKGIMTACSNGMVLLEATGSRRGAQCKDAIGPERLEKVSKHFFQWVFMDTKTLPVWEPPTIRGTRLGPQNKDHNIYSGLDIGSLQIRISAFPLMKP